MLRIAYPQFIHYEFYVPIEAGRTKYVGVMVQFKVGLAKFLFYAKYLTGIRWLFHGQFSAQDHWMVAETDAPARAALPAGHLADRMAPTRRGGGGR